MENKRLVALDVFRGMTLALMLIVNNPGDWGQVFDPFLHADWHGCTLTDLVFPFFLFIVGVAIPLAFSSRQIEGFKKKDLYLKILKRTVLIFLIGLALSGFPYYKLGSIRIPGVLQRIALVYGFVAILYLRFKPKDLFIILIIILLVYWALMTLIRVPGLGYASLEPETNLGAWLDYKLLKGHLWSASKVWDPEGLLSTLPACGTGIIGVLTGLAIKRPDPLREKVNRIFFYGAILLCIGYFWSMVFPLNKKIWTSSFVVFTGGLGLMVLASLIYIIDIKKMDRWTHHFLYFGMNSMMVFVGSGLVARLMGLITWMHQGTKMTLKGFLYQGLKQSWLDPKVSSLLFALGFLGLFYVLLRWMYNKRIFWKL
ncbi:MAG: DUF5009 domain-containing protein [Saprospiraceae bacterium]|nr:DUF5009 domain-containing protein [Saprospiraceae bacterium]MBK9930591.1 DUF5009 domain-containing protein [Saprospiraceae bacterium]